MTADELLAMPDDGYRYELVEGELRRLSPAGDEHGRVTLTEKDKLDGGDVVPGFQMNVAEIFG
jgi:hypothetical protein